MNLIRPISRQSFFISQDQKTRQGLSPAHGVQKPQTAQIQGTATEPSKPPLLGTPVCASLQAFAFDREPRSSGPIAGVDPDVFLGEISRPQPGARRTGVEARDQRELPSA